jgi:hypothetical protein
MRDLVSYDEMLENRDELKNVFDDFKARYYVLGRKQNGKFKTSDLDRLIRETIAQLKDRQKLIAEGFLEFVLGFLFNSSWDSTKAFNSVNKIFGW